MRNIKKRPLWVAGDKLNDAVLILNKAKIPALRQVSILAFDLFTACVTSLAWIAAIIAVSILN